MSKASREPRASSRPFLLRNSTLLMRAFYQLPYAARRKLFATLRPSKFQRLQIMRTTVSKTGYAFKPFDENQCIFVHIPKTAGISISQTLFGSLGGGHARVAEFQLIYNKDDFANYFKFTFIRNPWDRLFSAYRFLVRGGMNEKDARWAAQFLSPYRDFEDFVTRGLNREMIWSYEHFVPQYEFLCLPLTKAILVDFVGLYENLEEDFTRVRDKLGMPASVGLRKDNVTSSRQCGYRDSYTEQMKGIVAEVYREDIALLGYDFDNTTLDAIRDSLPRVV